MHSPTTLSQYSYSKIETSGDTTLGSLERWPHSNHPQIKNFYPEIQTAGDITLGALEQWPHSNYPQIKSSGKK